MSISVILNKKTTAPLLLLPVWLIIYNFLQSVTDWFIDDFLGMTAGSHLTETLRFFIFEVPKVLLLLTLIIFLVGIVRTYFSPEKTRKALAFMMAVIGLSFPEVIILKKVLKLPFILTFAGIMAAGIMLVGLLFNAIM